ncbi:6-phosphogluconate dehydrogenase, decarboxylating [Thiorhodovibrio winogradskyi]|uniref:6-phosphogluconate dehydrogenase, decarboxylating n=1 Tax=Thiorhodovibrio winogradskyi TaxID=77007 RepID=A0ABZ0SFS7_9GAMM|nr:NAD(P)-binding domain-containing protein [Thiorhodovibrio winogradskyi]
MAANDQRSEIGLIGLAVMGQNLALNIADHGFRISVYNRTTEKMQAFVDKHPDTPGGLVGCETLEALVNSLKRPRKIVVMVKAGSGTDAVIDQLAPLLDEGDILVDLENKKCTNTIAREQRLAGRRLRFIGSGISGGEEGARFGPSLMPGGQKDAWKEVEPVWSAIAAKVDPDTCKPLLGAKPGRPVQGGEPCTAYIGSDGAGHYVKMLHNGIEYGDMQMICEAYRHEPELANLLLAPHFKEAIDSAQHHWRKVVALAAQHGVTAPTFAASLAYYDSYRSARLPQKLLQAQRDYFGAHTYERVYQLRGCFFHIDRPDPKRPQRGA